MVCGIGWILDITLEKNLHRAPRLRSGRTPRTQRASLKRRKSSRFVIFVLFVFFVARKAIEEWGFCGLCVLSG